MIEFSHVSKCFKIETERARSFQQVMINAWRRSRRQAAHMYWALKDVSFQVAPGEGFALIGANGSGKSTALKLAARIIEPTSGAVAVRGRLAALLELGAGFHPDLSGRENVYLNGSILGLNKAYIRRQFDHIVAFAELERFIDTPVRNYSSGMLMRLGFSVATAFQPDILVIDEVLAVGDAAFQSRCMRRISEIQREGATIVLVSHDLSAAQRLCQRAIWLDEGDVAADGPTQEVINRYLEHLWVDEGEKKAAATAAGQDQPAPRGAQAGRWGSGEARIERVELLGPDEQPCHVFHTGDRLVIRMWYHAAQAVERPAFGVSFYDEQGNRLNGPNTIWSHTDIPRISGEGCVEYVVDALPLLSGRYDVTVAVYDRFVAQPYDHRHREITFAVTPGATERQDGSIYIPCRWTHTPAGR